MKFLVLLSFFCLATAKSVSVSSSDHTLEDSVHDFIKEIDFNKVLPIVLEALSEDDQVIEAMEFIQGPEFIRIVEKIQSMPQFKNTLNTLNDLGLDVYYYLNSLAGIMGWPEILPKIKSEKSSRTLIGFIQNLKDALPSEKFQELYDDKMINDEVFIAAIKAIGSPEFNQIGDVVQQMDEWKELLQRLEDKGVDTTALLKAIMDFFGWK